MAWNKPRHGSQAGGRKHPFPGCTSAGTQISQSTWESWESPVRIPPNKFTLEKVGKSRPKLDQPSPVRSHPAATRYRNPQLLTFGGAESMDSDLHHILLYRAAHPGGESRAESKAGIARGEGGEFWYSARFLVLCEICKTGRRPLAYGRP
jgi:hypothetical protein